MDQGGRGMALPGGQSGDREEGGVGPYTGGTPVRPYLYTGCHLRGKGGKITGETKVWSLSNWLGGDPAEGEGAELGGRGGFEKKQ